MANVGIGQQEIVDGIARGRGMTNALLQRPQLACPTSRQIRPGNDIETSFPLDRFGDGGRAVAAAVVDQNDAERPGIVLAEQAADGLCDNVGFVSGRNDRHDGGPSWRGAEQVVIALARQPIAAPRDKQVEPHREGKQSDASPESHVR